MATKYSSKPDQKLASCSPAASRLLFELAVPELVSTIARALSNCATANDELLHGTSNDKATSTRFHARAPPPISLEAYLTRLLQLTPYPLDVLLLAVVYINRVTHLKAPPSSQVQCSPLFATCRPKRSTVNGGSADPSPPLTKHTAHRLMLSALVVAAAYSSDHFIARNRMAKVAGVTMKEIHELEMEMFSQLSYDCVVHSGELESVCAAIWETTGAGKKEQAEQTRVASLSDTAEHAQNFCYTSNYLPTDFSGMSLSPRAPPRVSFLVGDDDAVSTPPLSEGESESSYFSSSSLESSVGELPSPSTPSATYEKARSSSRTVTPTLPKTMAIGGVCV